jgi:hypothetical protein
LVRVAAEAFIFESVGDILCGSFTFLVFLYLAGYAWTHVAHHIVKLFFLYTGRAEICTASADCLVRLGVCASELTGGAYVYTAAAQPADIRLDIKRSANASFLTSVAESDGLGHHLLLTHSHAQATKDTIFIFLLESLPANTVRRSKVLDYLGLGTGSKKQLQYHFTRP